MSADFDLIPVASTGHAPAGADPAPYPPRLPQPKTRTVPLAEPEGADAGEMRAFLVTGGPAVALIAGCYLLWAYGPWLLLGAMLLAAVAAVVTIRSFAAQARRGRSQQRAAKPPRAGPARPGALRSLLGHRGGGATGRGGQGAVKPGGGGPLRPGTGPATRRPGAAAGGTRTARRQGMLGHTGAGKAPGKAPGGAGTAGRGTGAGVKSAAGAAPGGAAKAAAASAVQRRQTRGGPAVRPAAPGLLRRTLAKTMPSGRPAGTTGKNNGGEHTKKTTAPKTSPRPTTKITTPKVGPKNTTAGTGKKTPAKNIPRTPVPKTLAGKKVKRGRIAVGGATTTGRRKVRIDPAKAAAAARRNILRRLTTGKKAGLAGARKTNSTRSKAAARIARTARRAATHRKVRSLRAKTLSGHRRTTRAVNGFVSPLAARVFLRTGKALGWAQRRMLRLANAGSGPAWAPGLARAAATGIGGLMTAGLWMSKRRRVQKWLLLHYAANRIGTPSAVLRAANTLTNPARRRSGHTAKPGPVIRITAPASPTLTTPGATVSSAAEEIAEMFEQMLAAFEPASPLQLTEHFEQFAPMLERFAAATTAHAQRLQDEFEIKGPVVEMIDQFGAAFGGMHDIAEEVVTSWRGEHAEDLARHEEPRSGEQDFWNYQGE